MATIKNGTFRGLTGSVGNTYMRVRNGKQEVCAKPANYNPSMEERPKAIRGMMQLLTHISHSLVDDKFFYDLWKVKEIKGLGPYNKFISKNHFGKNNVLPYDKLTLSPFDECFTAEVENFSVTEKKIHIELKPLGNSLEINTVREPFILSRGIIHCSGCNTTVAEILKAKSVHTPVQPIDLNAPIILEYKNISNNLWNIYDEVNVLFILATLNSEEKLVQTSVTMICKLKP